MFCSLHSASKILIVAFFSKDIAMIFRFNRECWGILHSFAELEPSELLQKLLL